MILVDTSVWVDHLRQGDEHLAALLEAGRVAVHPFVIGELACGHLQHRQRVLSLLQALPVVRTVDDAEAMWLIESRGLMGKGLGWVDVHLMASAMLNGVPLWTRDKSLRRQVEHLGMGHSAL